MEFIKTNKYLEGNFAKPIDFNELKSLEKIKVNQKLELLPEKENTNLLNSYGQIGFKIIPIRRMSNRDWAKRIDFPNRIVFEMTSRCNASCRMCPRHNLKRPLIDFDKDLYLKVVDELNQHGIEGIWLFHLGEPLLHNDWQEIVHHVTSEKNIEFTWFSTNGMAFNEKAQDFILNSKLSFLNFSLHGTNEEVYSYVSDRKFYKEVRENLEKFLQKKKKLSRGPIVHIQMIDQEGTHSNINEFLETLYPTGEIISINTLEYANLPNNQYGLKRERPPVVRTCKRISRGDCFIVSNGDVQPCDATYNSEIILGNVKEKSVYEIWNSDVRKSMLNLNNKGELYQIEHCRKCTDYDL